MSIELLISNLTTAIEGLTAAINASNVVNESDDSQPAAPTTRGRGRPRKTADVAPAPVEAAPAPVVAEVAPVVAAPAPVVAAPAPVVVEVAPVPAPVAPAPVVVPTVAVAPVVPAAGMPPLPNFEAMVAPVEAAPATPKAPFSDTQGLMAYVMASWNQLGQVEGAKIQNILTSLGVSNVNGVRPDQYDVFYAGVEALKAGV